MVSTHLCGCYYLTPPSQAYYPPQRNYLPLQSSSFHSTILSNTSCTVLTQKFRNLSKDVAITECTYTFPLYADVSVIKFTCRVGETVLRGIVKEKFEAKEIFDAAVAKGETAGLLEQSPDESDVFSTKLGSIPVGESVFVEISYIGELKANDGDNVRFTIPTSIAPRYGSTTNDWQNQYSYAVPPSSARSDGSIKIVVDIDIPDGSFIKGVQSPSHPIAVSMGTLSTATNAEPAMSKASATLALGSAALEKDFVLIVQSKVAALPKALLETHRYIPNQRALMATLVPKFTLPPTTPRPEIIFVADRSGSMSHNIPMLIDAMKVFLKSMPAGVKFNICSFGSRHSFLWPTSKSYDADTLKQASQHIQTFSADMGGTETFAAIKAAIEQRWTDIPLELMLLTDGDIRQQNKLFTYLNEQVETSKGNIRVFPLGIGSGVSHALIEGVARAGNGFAQAVQQGERLDTSVVRMLRAALSPHITDYSLDIKYKADDDFEIIETVTEGMRVLLNEVEAPETKATISLFDTNAEPKNQDLDLEYSQLPHIPTPKLLQAPHKIPTLFASARSTVYIIMSPTTFRHNPTSVIFRASSAHGPLELEIPVEVLTEKGETIHQLAAKKASQDLEEGRGWIYDARDQNSTLIRDKFPSSFDDLVKKEAVRLGENFQVAGKWCSFVAVVANDEGIKPTRAKKAIHETTTEGNHITCAVSPNTLDSSAFHVPSQGNTDVILDFDFDSFLHQVADTDTFDFGHNQVATPIQIQGTLPPQSFSAQGQGNHALQGYQMKMMPLEQQNKKRLMMTRQEQDVKTDQGECQASQFAFGPQTSQPQMYNPSTRPAMFAQQQMASQLAQQSQLPMTKRVTIGTHSTNRPFGSLIDHSGDSRSTNRSAAYTQYSPASPSAQEATLLCNSSLVLSANNSCSSNGGAIQVYSSQAPRKRKVMSRSGVKRLSAQAGMDVRAVGEVSDMDYEETEKDWAVATSIDKLHALIELQNFDGSWPADKLENINAILGKDVGQNSKGENTALWLTTIVVAYIEIKISDEEETWEMIVEKAKNWIGDQGDMNFKALEKEASAFVAAL